MSDIKIEIVSGPMDGQEFSLYRDEYTVGRSETNDISLPLEAGVNADSHLVLKVSGDGTLVARNNSSDPFFVDGEAVQDRADLSQGQSIRVGRTELLVTQLEGSPGKASEQTVLAFPDEPKVTASSGEGMKTCPRAQCRAENNEDEKYCQKCGARLDTP